MARRPQAGEVEEARAHFRQCLMQQIERSKLYPDMPWAIEWRAQLIRDLQREAAGEIYPDEEWLAKRRQILDGA
jgi:hypothetical protein